MKKIILILLLIFTVNLTDYSAKNIDVSTSKEDLVKNERSFGGVDFKFMATSYDVVFSITISDSTAYAYRVELADLGYTANVTPGSPVTITLSLSSRINEGEIKELHIYEYSAYGNENRTDISLEIFGTGYDFSIADPSGGTFHIYEEGGVIYVEKYADSLEYTANIDDMVLWPVSNGYIDIDASNDRTTSNVTYRLNYGDSVYFTSVDKATVDRITVPTLANFAPLSDSEMYVSISENGGAFRKLKLTAEGELSPYLGAGYTSDAIPFYTDDNRLSLSFININPTDVLFYINNEVVTEQPLINKMYTDEIELSDIGTYLQVKIPFGSMFEHSYNEAKDSTDAKNVFESNISLTGSGITSFSLDISDPLPNFGNLDPDNNNKFNSDNYTKYEADLLIDKASTDGIYPFEVNTKHNGFTQSGNFPTPDTFVEKSQIVDGRMYSLVDDGGILALEISSDLTPVVPPVDPVDGEINITKTVDNETLLDGTRIENYTIAISNDTDTVQMLQVADVVNENFVSNSIADINVISNFRGDLKFGVDYNGVITGTNGNDFSGLILDVEPGEIINITYSVTATS